MEKRQEDCGVIVDETAIDSSQVYSLHDQQWLLPIPSTTAAGSNGDIDGEPDGYPLSPHGYCYSGSL